MTVSARREREQIMRREAILDSARKLFTDNGYESTTVDAIAAKAELGKGTIYSYFSGKEEIYLAILERELTILHNNMQKAVETSSTAAEALSNLYAAFIRHHKEYHLPESIFVQVGDQRFIRLDGLLSKLREQASGWVQMISAVVKRGIESGELICCDVEKVAKCIIGMILGITVQASMGQIKEDLEVYNGTVFQIVMRGIKKS